ncbi:amidohydrolase family protein [Paenibacillus hexagrammi]|uniref:Amidohydrolase family protein n=1 Tax=Paenibacillus hexagrammi TaxID=2908839 RepID=A0ABY3SDQ0_9BACL|nr:amidohydrolase family protein [Paenibacillus sp. YPD9-1]UJF31321.1 amidohydrolase family protein [Paenibacillus sp. YPD9-1]
MQGRFDGFPKGRGIARIKEMLQAGVNVSIAHDDIQTPFYPLGNGSLLQAAHMAAHLAHMTGRQDLYELVRMVTDRAAQVMQLGSYGISEGNPASFVLMPAEDAADLLRVQPVCRYVVRHGRIISQTTPPQNSLNVSLS